MVDEEIPPFILGDATYPNRKHLVTTFKTTECRNPIIAKLNKQLGGARYIVEHAFGLLKGRFRVFQTPLQCVKESVEVAVILMTACFVLHNFLIDVRDTSGDWSLDLDVLRDENPGNEEQEELEGEIQEAVELMRLARQEPTRAKLIRHIKYLYEDE